MKVLLLTLALISAPAFSSSAASPEQLLQGLRARGLAAPAAASTLAFYLNKLGCGSQPSARCVAEAGRRGAANDAAWRD